MESIIANMFSIRDTAHLLHLKSKSFAKHIALGDFYDGILELADSITEIYQGKYGILEIPQIQPLQKFNNEIDFIKYAADWAEECKASINPQDTYLLNEWDNVISLIFRTKYKLENLN